MEIDICAVCESDKTYDWNNRHTKERTSRMKRYATLQDDTEIAKDATGTWTAGTTEIYECPACGRFYLYEYSEDWEPTGISKTETLRHITKKQVEERLQK